MADPDGDDVRCRWPSGSAEGGSVNPIPNAELDEVNKPVMCTSADTADSEVEEAEYSQHS